LNPFSKAFNPIAKHRIRPNPPAVQDQFIAKSNGDWQMLNYFEDTPENITTVKKN